ncbi:MAG: F0F1 ATP synthase subunit B [Clostridia bacterium]|nr:F0F1 ATP synthase subunit B [Clostridia bacterium]
MEFHTGLIEINWTSLMILINVFILYIILKKFFWEKIKKFMDDRANAVKDKIDVAEAMNKRADAKMADYTKRISNVEEEGREIIKEAKVTADAQAQHIIEEARKEAASIIISARAAAELEREKAMDDMRQEIAQISMMVAQQIVEREVNEIGQESILDDAIQKARNATWQS